MATDLQPAKPSGSRPSGGKYEAFVEEQLARARGRIRALDMSVALLGLFVATLGYGLVLAVADRWLELPSLVRQAAFTVFALGALAYAALAIVRPLCRHINPYFAARQIESTLPEAKNSVVNWLDLHGQALPTPIRAALSHKAARDLGRVDLEQAISARRAAWLGGIAGGLFVGLVALFVLGPRQFPSLMSRAFAPFIEAPIATRTRITIQRPEGGDVTVPVGRAVSIAVFVEGKVPDPAQPDALRLHFRYNPADPYEERLLERGESGRDWGVTVPAAHVRNGFWYKVTGGDAGTAEHRVQVRSTPLLTGFEVTYHYPPYLGWKDDTTRDPNLQAIRGTQVTVLARANRVVKNGQITLAGTDPVPAELVPGEPQALRFRWTLDQQGSYRVWFTSVDGEKNTEPMPYTIHVLQDRPPTVEIRKPGDVSLPADGLLQVEGTASDDHGLARLTLRLQAADDGPVLQPKVYREGKPLLQGDGSLPTVLEYRDFVPLDQLQRTNGQPFPLTPGMKVQYWLEAVDNCDYPEPGKNIGESKRHTITIASPQQDPAQKEQQQEQARKEQKQHEAQQDRQLQQQKREPQQDQPQGGAASPEKQDGQKGEKQDGQKGDQPQQGERQEGKPQPQEGGKGDDGDLQKKLDDIRKAIEQQEKEQGKQNQQQGEGQPSPAKEGAQGQPKPQQQPGDGKKDQGQPSPMSEPKDGKSEGTPDQKPGASGAKPDQKPGAEEKKEPGAGGAQQQPGERQEKPEAKPGMGDQKEQPQAGEPGARGDQPRQEKTQDPGKGQEKPEAKPGMGDQKEQSQADRKPGAGQGQDSADKKDGANAPRPDAAPKPREGDSAGQQPRDGAQQPSPRPNAGEQKQQPGAEGSQPKPDSQTGMGGQPKPDQAGQPNTPRPDARGNEGQQGPKKDDGQQGPEKNAGKPGMGQDQRPDQGRGKPEAKPAADMPKDANAGKPEGDTGKPDTKPADKGQGQPETKPDGAKPEQKSDPMGGQPAAKGTEPEAGPEKRPGSESKKPGKPSNDPKDQDARGPERRAPESPNAIKSKDPAAADAPPKETTDKPGAEKSPRETASKDAKPGSEQKPDIDELLKQLQSPDAQQRDEAMRKAEDLIQTCKDPATCKKLGEALGEARKQGGGDTGMGQGKGDEGKDRGPKPGGTPKEPGKQPGEGASAGNQGKPDAQRRDPGMGQGDGPGRSPDGKPEPGQPGDTPGDGRQPAKGGPQGQPRDGASRGTGGPGQPGSQPNEDPNPRTPGALQGASESAPEEGTAAEPRHRKLAGNLQLDDLKKKVNPDILKKANMTEEEFQKFVKAYEEMLKRQGQAPGEQEKLAGPQLGNRTLPNQGVRRVDTGVQDKASTLERSGPALAPPEFRPAYKEFSRRLAEIERAREKK